MDGEDRKTPPERYADRHLIEGDWYHGIAKELEKDGTERGRDHEGKPEQDTGKEQSQGPDKETR